MTEEFTAEQLWQVLQRQRGVRRWLVGFSGGLDSTALMAALRQIAPPQPVVALHVNHGLSPRADAWQAHCQALCRQWDVDCRVEAVNVATAGRGLEDAARQARYQAFAAQMRPGDVLLLGHHRDDQAETLLFRLMRGAGPRGLSGIAPERPFAAGRLIRPLLDFSRAELEAYVRDQGLEWVEDEGNRDESLDRNFLRAQITPRLATRWPDFTRRWAQSARACAEADQLNAELAALDCSACGERAERLGYSIDREAVLGLADHRRGNLLRHWPRGRGYELMDRRQLKEIERQLLQGPPSAKSCVRWGHTALRYYRERLYLTPALEDFAPRRQSWSLDGELHLASGGRLRAEPAPAGLKTEGRAVEVGWRRGGERCRPLGRRHSQSLKKLLQEYGLEPWLRDRLPLVYVGGDLAAVGDLWICQGFAAEQGDVGCRLTWEPAPQTVC